MSNIPAWFGRRFELTYPLELYPNLIARLRGTPARLDEALRHRMPATLTTQPHGDTRLLWSAQEHAGHLADLEALWLARVHDFSGGTATTLTPTDLGNRRTDDAQHNATPLEEILFAFRSQRMQLIHHLATLTPSPDTPAFTRTIPHPRLGSGMRLVDHLHFVAEHDDHHLAHIWTLLTRTPL